MILSRFKNSSRVVRAALAVADEIIAEHQAIRDLTDVQLAERADQLRAAVRSGTELDEILVAAFALVREATRREIGLEHYPVQLAGGVVLHNGLIAEMRTGEGKTITALPPVFLHSLDGLGAHVVTANDYLAARDAELAGKILARLGCTVGLVVPTDSDIASKKAAYACDITYGTAQEIGFDYLRDNVANSADEIVQRGFQYALVDEIDSVLIDDAYTPLIISAPGQIDTAGLAAAKRVADTLQRVEHYDVDREHNEAALNAQGWEVAERMYGADLTDPRHSKRVAQLNNALSAKELKVRDVHYLVDDDQILIIDEGTGRALEGRRWSWGLHQAIEAKEGVTVRADSKTIASVTLQYLFRMYARLSGMTGTAKSSLDEFQSMYDLDVVEVPTNKPSVRIDAHDMLWPTMAAKHGAVAADAAERAAKGQPVLIGTPSVAESEAVSAVLDERGVAHTVLNAKRHREEAEIVAQAGRPGAVTVATNMAGRGVDIILGGDAARLAAAELATLDDPDAAAIAEVQTRWAARCAADAETVRSAGGLAVIGCARHDSRRIDDQLRGRAGRQGDPGFSQFHLSLDDELLEGLADGPLSGARRLGRPLEGRVVSRAVEKAQQQRGANAVKARRMMFERDAIVGMQRAAVYARRAEFLTGGDADMFEAELRPSVLRARDAAIGECGDDRDALVAFVARLTRLDAAGVEQLRQAADSELGDVLGEMLVGQLAERRAEFGDKMFAAAARQVLVGAIDTAWIEHLEALEALSEAVSLRAMGKEDPRTAWKHGASELYDEMQRQAATTTTMWMLRSELTVQPNSPDATDADGGSAATSGDGSADVGSDDVQPGGGDVETADTAA